MSDDRRRTRRALTVACCAALTLGACSSGGDTDSSPPEAVGSTAVVAAPTPPEPEPTSTATAPNEGSRPTGDVSTPAVPELLQFSASLIGGGEYDADALAGKPTVLWFWAPWCPNCNREASSIEAAAQEFGDDVNFVGVAWTGSEAEFQEFVDDHELSFPQVSDDPGVIFERFGVAYQPALVIVGTDGSTELVAGSIDDTLLHQIISDST